MNSLFLPLDEKIASLIKQEQKRQNDHIELIASENYASPAVMQVTGSCFTNKYAEGYPQKRYYAGCEYIDEGELLAIERARALFTCHCDLTNCTKAYEHVNVQPHSGSQANAAVYYALLQPHDTFLAMDLASGGHLTHGHKVNFSGRFYKAVHYQVDQTTEKLNYAEIATLAKQHQPKLIVAGYSAYSLTIDFAKLREIADSVGAYLLVDMAHIAGLIAAKLHPSPMCYADVVTTTTHKTLRGPRGGMIFARKSLGSQIDKAIFPGNQGGPLEHVILAKAQAFYEAQQPSFVAYQKQIIKNTHAFVDAFQKAHFYVVANGSDNHLFTVNTMKSPCHLTGKAALDRLNEIAIIANKNMVPNDPLTPWVTSGVRFGTPAMTTRGFVEDEFTQLTNIIITAWMCDEEAWATQKDVLQKAVNHLTARFPIY